MPSDPKALENILQTVPVPPGTVPPPPPRVGQGLDTLKSLAPWINLYGTMSSPGLQGGLSVPAPGGTLDLGAGAQLNPHQLNMLMMRYRGRF